MHSALQVTMDGLPVFLQKNFVLVFHISTVHNMICGMRNGRSSDLERIWIVYPELIASCDGTIIICPNVGIRHQDMAGPTHERSGESPRAWNYS